jgi:hypothetical protein
MAANCARIDSEAAVAIVTGALLREEQGYI